MTMAAAPRDPALLAHLRVPAEACSLRLIRRVVREAALLAGAADAWADDLVLAVDEACQNVVRHGYAGAPGDIVVTLARTPEGDGVVTEILDFAPPVDPALVRGRDLDDVRPGGLGVHLIEALCEEAGFTSPPEGAGNLFRMVKRFAKTAQQG